MTTFTTNANAPRERGAAGIADDTLSFSYPPAGTVKARFLAALLQGRVLTHLDCWREFGSSRAAHHAYVLRRDGWPVQTSMQTVLTSDGRREEIAYYTLPAETISKAGERGRRFSNAAGRAQ